MAHVGLAAALDKETLNVPRHHERRRCWPLEPKVSGSSPDGDGTSGLLLAAQLALQAYEIRIYPLLDDLAGNDPKDAYLRDLHLPTCRRFA